MRVFPFFARNSFMGPVGERGGGAAMATNASAMLAIINIFLHMTKPF